MFYHYYRPFYEHAPWLHQWFLSRQCNGHVRSCWLHPLFQRSVAQGGKALCIFQPLLHLKGKVLYRKVNNINLTDFPKRTCPDVQFIIFTVALSSLTFSTLSTHGWLSRSIDVANAWLTLLFLQLKHKFEEPYWQKGFYMAKINPILHSATCYLHNTLLQMLASIE